MPFFLPSRLVEFEYFGDNSGEVDESYNDLAKGYERDIDFAFFFVNFNTSKRDFMELTKREKIFIRKAWEEKEVRESTFLRNAVMNAVANAMRDKKTPFRDLWKKKQKPVDFGEVKIDLDVIEESNKKDGFDWVAEIYKANGFNKPVERGN